MTTPITQAARETTMNLTPERLAEIRAYCEKVPKEPWKVGHDDIPTDWNLGERICAGGKVMAATIEPEDSKDPLAVNRELGKAIADFIANARLDLPAAVEEIKALREFRQLAVDALNELQSLRKQIIHGGAWTKKVDALFERARKAGL